MATKALVIYHANCDDGFGAAFAFWKYAAKNYDSVIYYPGVYGQPWPVPDKDTEVFILDFSYHMDTMVKIAGLAKYVTLLDHHKTAYESYIRWSNADVLTPHPENWTIQFDMSRSGAMMALDYFAYDEDCDKFFKFLQDRDLWKFDNPHTKSFTRFLRARPKDFECWNIIAKRLNIELEYKEIIHEGRMRLAEYENICKEIVGTSKRSVYINGVRGLECNCPGQFASDIGNILATESGTFGHTWQLLGGRSQHSLRSIGDFDVSAIAKDLGGGGHKNAAGFSLEGQDTDSLKRFEDMFKRENPNGLS